MLNKIDLMWDDLKSDAESRESVERQLESTSQLLMLPRTHVLAISAQKALVARVRDDGALLARSNIEQLEQLLAQEIIPSRQEIMRAAVEREIGRMVDASRLAVANQLVSIRNELKDLAAVSGKNRNLALAMVARLEVDRRNYQASVDTFRATFTKVMAQGAELLKQSRRRRNRGHPQQGPRIHRGRVDHRRVVEEHAVVVPALHQHIGQNPELREPDQSARQQHLHALPRKIRLREPGAAHDQPRTAHARHDGRCRTRPSSSATIRST